MPSLNFKGLQKIESTTKHSFVDLHLDFSNPVERDIKADYDESAIANSIVNLFNTSPGQNLLNPEYGLNLLQYVFLPATDTTARMIGQNIMNNLSTFEPRVSVKNININVDPDQQIFTITLSILIPSLNAQLNIPGTLTKTGFTLLK
jgi:phage baseplate assembly protein W